MADKHDDMTDSDEPAKAHKAKRKLRRPRIYGRRLPLRKGLSFRAMLPNAITAMALCFGLTSVRFALDEKWHLVIVAILCAAILDAVDGRVARLLHAQSRFGAELDSLSDLTAFGVSPAIVLYLWSMHDLPKFGWIIVLALALCCALRLARFNAQIDLDEQPHKMAGFLTGVPAPLGAALAFLPMILWLETGMEFLRHYAFMGGWIAFVAILMISNVATWSWSSLRIRRNIRLEALVFIGLLAAALLTMPWVTLTGIGLVYILSIPFSQWRYWRIKKARLATEE